MNPKTWARSELERQISRALQERPENAQKEFTCHTFQKPNLNNSSAQDFHLFNRPVDSGSRRLNEFLEEYRQHTNFREKLQ
jgi:hypothetical protein